LDAKVESHTLDLEVHITTKDFGLSTDRTSAHLKLPLDKLRAEIPAAMREYSLGTLLKKKQWIYLMSMA
jgi:hypothetical protein